MQHSNWDLRYELREEPLTAGTEGSGISYGLICTGTHPALERTAILAHIPGISQRRDFVAALAQLFTLAALPPERMGEAVAVLL